MNTHGLIRIATLLYIIFVVYGSLVPLELSPMPLADAVERFRQIPYLQIGIGSRADWVANLLLFIPLSYLLMSALPGRTSLFKALLIWVGCTMLAFCIEFTQMFFPPRTVSQNDLFAESLGAILGLTAWGFWGKRSVTWLEHTLGNRKPLELVERLLFLYLAGVILYQLLPLDLTISPVEIYHKWRQGRIILMPFSNYPDGIKFVYAIAADIVIWIPVGLLFRLSNRTRSDLTVVLRVVAVASLLEVLQIFVFSRFTETTDVLTAMAGGTAGTMIANFVNAPGNRPVSVNPATWLPLAMLTAWSILLMLVFWYPYNFTSDPETIRERALRLYNVPFHAYYYGSEFRALTELLHKVLFFAPVGALVAWHTHLQRSDLLMIRRNPFLLLLMAATPVVIEIGQIALPGKYPETTDIFLEWIGIFGGYFLAKHVFRVWVQHTDTAHDLPSPAKSAHQPQAMGIPHWRFMTLTLAAVIGMSLTAYSESVPYNLRELFDAGPAPLVSIALLLVMIILVAPTVPIGSVLIDSRKQHPGWLSTLLIAPSIVFLVLWLAVPQESLDDILGSKILGIPPMLEDYLRFLALSLVTMVALSGGPAGWFALRSVRPSHFARWLLTMIAVGLLGHWAIVSHASTDNLVELIRGNGHPITFAALIAWLWLLALVATAVGPKPTRDTPWFGAVLLALVSFPLGYGLFAFGTSPEINKYGQKFSAMQFLFSPDREHYVEDYGLLWRYGMFHAGTLALIAYAQRPAWIWLSRRKKRLASIPPRTG